MNLYNLAVEVFKHEYSQRKIALYDDFLETKVTQILDDRVEIYVFDMIINTIKLFGQDIRWIFVYDTKMDSNRYEKKS